MRFEAEFSVRQPPEPLTERLHDEATLLDLFAEGEPEVVARRGRRRTIRTRYHALGREGVATFHLELAPDGGLRFEKVCDGKVWQELQGTVTLEPRGAGTRVRVEIEGRTRRFVPELAVRGAVREQLDRMVAALRRRLAGRSS